MGHCLLKGLSGNWLKHLTGNIQHILGEFSLSHSQTREPLNRSSPDYLQIVPSMQPRSWVHVITNLYADVMKVTGPPEVGSVPAWAVTRYWDEGSPLLVIRYCKQMLANVLSLDGHLSGRRTYREEWLQIGAEFSDSSRGRNERKDVVFPVATIIQVPMRHGSWSAHPNKAEESRTMYVPPDSMLTQQVWALRWKSRCTRLALRCCSWLAKSWLRTHGDHRKLQR